VAWLSTLLPEFGHLGALATALVVFRALTASVEGMAAWLVVTRAPTARVFLVGSAIAAAVLTTLIVGYQLAPTDVPPVTNQLVVAAYWLVALVTLVVGRSTTAR
jgi:hypothetical protein